MDAAFTLQRASLSVELRSMSDESLMRVIADGGTHALEELYDRYVKGCFGLALKIVRDPAVAEEVVQDVFVKLWNQASFFSPERGKFSKWLLTLVHNRSVDKLRRAKPHSQANLLSLETASESGVSLADSLQDSAPGPEEHAWSKEKGDILRQALSQLPEPQRKVLSLAYFDGLTQKEIAERLREPIGTIKTRTRTGLKQLRKLLGRDGLLLELQ